MRSFDDGLISIVPKKSIEIAAISANGDVITVSLDVNAFKQLINEISTIVEEDEQFFNEINSSLPQNERITYAEYRSLVEDLAQNILKDLNKMGVTNIALEFYVNNKNEIVAINFSVIAPEKSSSFKAIFVDNENEGYAVSLQSEGKEIFSYVFKKDSEDATEGMIHIYKLTENGPLDVDARFSNYLLSEDSFRISVLTEPFKIPAHEELGLSVVDLSMLYENDKISIFGKVSVKGLLTADIALNGEKTEYMDFQFPSKSQIKPFDKEKLKSEALDFFATELPNKHSAFSKVYRSILKYYAQDKLTSFFNGSFLFGENSIFGKFW